MSRHDEYRRDWGKRAQAFRHLDGRPATLVERYMRDEERSDDARIRARHRTSEPSTWREARLYLGIAGWVVLTVILGVQTAAYMGWLG